MSMCFCGAQLEGLLADVQSRVLDQESEFRVSVSDVYVFLQCPA